MSQMLVRIDKETDKALTYIYDNYGTVSLNGVAVVMAIVRRIYEQWKPNHEAMLKLRDEARKKNEAIGKCRQSRLDDVRNLHGEYSTNRKQCALPSCHGGGANKEQEMTRAVVFDSEAPDIIELRKEFEEKFGSTELFDYFYINLRNRIAKDTMKAMIDRQKFGELIHEKVKASMEVVDGNRN